LQLPSKQGESSAVRITAILARILALKQTRIVAVHLEPEGLVLDVAPTTRVPCCSGCCKGVHAVHDRYEGRRWRHLDVAGMRLWLRYEIRRVRCPRCGVTVELVPWAETQSWFTRDFEQHVAYLAQRADKTTLSDMMRIGVATVGSIIERVVARLRPDGALDGLRLIGVDELSYRRHHQYVTIVVDHERGAVVWAREGKDTTTFKAFFEELGKERCAKLEAVTSTCRRPTSRPSPRPRRRPGSSSTASTCSGSPTMRSTRCAAKLPP
jgi:transposase